MFVLVCECECESVYNIISCIYFVLCVCDIYLNIAMIKLYKFYIVFYTILSKYVYLTFLRAFMLISS